jgi:hypothetical protein
VKGSKDGIPEIETSRSVARNGGGMWAVAHYVRVCVYKRCVIKGVRAESSSLVGSNPRENPPVSPPVCIK